MVRITRNFSEIRTRYISNSRVWSLCKKRMRRTVLIPNSNHRSDVKGCGAALRCKFHCYVTTARLSVYRMSSRVCFTRTYAMLLLSSFNRLFFPPLSLFVHRCVLISALSRITRVWNLCSLLRICSCQQSLTCCMQLCKTMWYFCRDCNYISGQDLQGKSANKKFQILHLKEFVRAKWPSSFLETSYLSELALCWIYENRTLINHLGVE
jgi:hypothetical protein